MSKHAHMFLKVWTNMSIHRVKTKLVPKPKSMVLMIAHHCSSNLPKKAPDALWDSYSMPLKMVRHLLHGSVGNVHRQRGQVGLYVSDPTGFNLANGSRSSTVQHRHTLWPHRSNICHMKRTQLDPHVYQKHLKSISIL